MTSQEEAILAQVDAQLNAMDAPSSAEVFYGLEEFSPRHQVAAAARVAKAGGGGGGNVPFVGVDPPDSPTDGMLWWDPDDDTPATAVSVPRWSNVATITYAEVLAKAADPCYLDLLTLPTGTIIDAFFLNLTEVFDDAGSIDLNLGWLMDTGSPRQLNDGNLLLNFSQDDWAGVMGSGDGFNSSFTSSEVKIGHYGGLVFDADVAGPFQAKFSAIVGDGNTGSFDLWLRTQAP